MHQKLLDARGRYQRMMYALSAGNPVDLELRRELQATIDAIDTKLAGLETAPAGEAKLGDIGL